MHCGDVIYAEVKIIIINLFSVANLIDVADVG
jgi:hypothetical protein